MAGVFEVIPAIDVSGGRLAVVTERGPLPADAFGGDPLAAATACVAIGATRLHVVDLDLAFRGEPRNLEIISAIAGLQVPVQAAGAVRGAAEVRSLIEAGASRVVLGSAALADVHEVSALIAAGGDRLLIGIEVDGGRIRSRGRDPVDLDLMETIGSLVAAGARGFLVTSVARVSSLGGPDVELVARVALAGPPVLAAGGVATLEHLRNLRAAGASGAVVGRAALDGSLDLTAAVAELG